MRELVKRALRIAQSESERHYWFSTLTSPKWIAALAEEGVFSQTPEPIETEKGYRWPRWPEGEYLSRFAEASPRLVGQVLLALPESRNPLVHEQVLRCAVHLEHEASLNLARREAEWLSTSPHVPSFILEAAGGLVASLVDRGHISIAARMCVAALAPVATPREHGVFSRGWAIRSEEYKYERFLSVVAVPSLAKAGSEGLELAAGLLEAFLDFSTDTERGDDRSDYSFIWAQDLADRDPHGDPKAAVLYAAKDVAVKVCNQGTPVEAVLEEFSRRRWEVFTRLSLAVQRDCAPPRAEHVRRSVLSRELFENVAVRPEYVRLLVFAFPSLDEQERRTVLDWIEAGPDIDAMRSRAIQFGGAPLEPEEEARWVATWKRDRLAPLATYLGGADALLFGDLVSRYGPPETTQLSGVTVRWGDPSPLREGELRALNHDELIRFLSEWTPSGERDGATRYGVVRELQGLGNEFFVSEATHARDWKCLPSEYVATFLRELSKAVAERKALDWPPVLDLVRAVCGLDGTRRGESDLLHAACRLTQNALDYSDRSALIHYATSLGEIVLALTRAALDSEATPTLEGASDWLSVAINNVHGQATELAVRYCVWLKRTDVRASPQGAELRSLVVGDVLRLIRRSGTAGASALAVVGLQIGPLLWAERELVIENVSLLTRSEGGSDVPAPFVESYLGYSQPLRDVVEIAGSELEAEFRRVLNEVPNERLRQTQEKMAHHVAEYVWSDTISTDSPLARVFYERASAEVRGQALRHVGLAMLQSEEIPPEVLSRIVAFGRWRIAEVSRRLSGDATAATEVREFGYWAWSRKLPVAEMLELIGAAARIAGWLVPAGETVEALTQVPLADLPVAGKIIEAMLSEGMPEFGIFQVADEALAFCKVGAANPDLGMRTTIQAIASSFVRRGAMQFRDFT